MNRRQFIRAGIGIPVFLSGLLPSSCSSQTKKKNPNSPLNLLIIHTDEHNFRTLGCYRKLLPKDQALIWGPEAVVETPNIDWIAEQGAICTSFYANTPVCSPSRSSFVSGLYPQNTPVVTNDIPMKDGIVTFAEILQQQGYKTGYAGKWHLDGSGKPQWEPNRKFGFQDNRYMFNRGHWKQLEDTDQGPRVAARKNGKPTYAVEGADEKNFTTDYLAHKTIDFIEAHKKESFCYMVSIPDPHGPNTVRSPYDTMYKDMKFEKPRTAMTKGKSLPKWAVAPKKVSVTHMPKYFGMVKCIDDNVGKILDALKEKQLIDKTILVFTSDHGDMCGEHGRQNKGVPFEASARIPFLIYAPQKIKPGTVTNEAMSTVDFLPTILSIMDIPASGTEQGSDVSTCFTQNDFYGAPVRFVFMRGASLPNKRRWLAVATKRYKLIFWPDSKPCLFDLEKDPDELVNYYEDSEYQETIQLLAQKLLAYGTKYRDPCIQDPQFSMEIKQVAET